MYPSLPPIQTTSKQDSTIPKDRSQSQPYITNQFSYLLPAIPSPISTLPLSSVFQYFCSTESFAVQKTVTHYKTTPCPQLSTCYKIKDCFYYHSAEDRRRPLFSNYCLAYTSQYCPVDINCPNGDHCYYSHNDFEVQFHPEQYKTKPCTEDCKQIYCPFAHSTSELRKREELLIYSFIEGHTSFTNLSHIDYTPFGTIKETPKRFPLDINTFKSKSCSYMEVHSQKQCVCFHSASDRRRVPVLYSYERCPMSKHSLCPLGDTCNKTHNTVEQLYHPEKYKRKMCHEYPNKVDKCDYGEFCSFAHSESELKIELIHEYEMNQNFYMHYFKTESCPFNHEHNKSICVYWHNWQDYRRKVEMPYPQYSSTLCSNWNTSKFINKYTEGCPRGFECQYSHGWKEYLYHPYFYKTTPCQDIEKCHQGPDCPYYHDDFDHRYPTSALPSAPVPKRKSWKGEQSMNRTNEVDRRFSEGLANVKAKEEIEKRSLSFLSLEGSSSAKSNSPAKTEDQTPMSTKPSLTDSIPPTQFANLKVSPEKEGTPEQKKGGLEEEKQGEGKKDELGSKSYPSSPDISHKIYGKIHALIGLHLDEEEENTENIDKLQLRNFMNSIGLEELTDRLLNAGYAYCDLLVEPERKCQKAGITNSNHIQKIVTKVHQILARPIGLESPSTILLNALGLEETESIEEEIQDKANVTAEQSMNKTSDYFK
jgi:hypothetical protein